MVKLWKVAAKELGDRIDFGPQNLGTLDRKPWRIHGNGWIRGIFTYMNGWFLWDQLVDRYTIISWILEDIPFLSMQPQNRTILFGTPKNCRKPSTIEFWNLAWKFLVGAWFELAMRFALQVFSLVSSEGFPDHPWEFLARNMDQWSKVCIYSENFENFI